MDPIHSRQPARRRTLVPWLVALAVLALGGAAFAIMWRPAIVPLAKVPRFDPAMVEKGARLAALGNCAACHTADPARPYAGGLAMETPFGTVHSTNITPDARTGIGDWSEAAFTRALREGVSRDGHLLYPAFPYDHYTRLARADVQALYAYVMTRTPLDAPAPANAMTFPFGFRPLVGLWNVVYLDRTPWRPDPARPADWNRGAYVADALAHCSACHSPRTRLGGEDRRRFLDGGEAEGWYVPALNRNSPSPLPWTRAQLAVYLRTGIAPDHAAAGGPMQGVVQGLAKADPADVEALATWLHAWLAEAPAAPKGNAALAGSLPAPPADAPQQLGAGYAVYAGACARCHEAGRAPTSGGALPLQKAVALYDPDPRSLVRIVREGIHPPDGEPGRWMPGFAGILDEGQTTALAAYLRHAAAQAPWNDLEQSVKKASEP
ncbi:c-type cytochrome [Massilia sp. YIM B02763]|uniref:c-type cytochrome n=1 Tax=Massilia sp. YIM B02763 TaxID=3050130 RepID=UPI0025B6AEC4|nr:c-type cytochrome [Massilia sp. YIM B02763]MDN4051591.1 c-type cytochrome [Massilia sp. YIM B02763]